MGRPKCCRRIQARPTVLAYGPLHGSRPAEEASGGETAGLALTLDEFEALRLADLEGLYHETAAERMKVSRPTFGRIVKSARNKVARMLVEGAALRIEPGRPLPEGEMVYICTTCRHEWHAQVAAGAPGASTCPSCRGGAVEPGCGATCPVERCACPIRRAAARAVAPTGDKE